MEYRYSDKMPVPSTEFIRKDGNVAAAALGIPGTPQLDAENSTVTSGTPHAATPRSQICVHDNPSDPTPCPNCDTFAFLNQLLPPTSGPSRDDTFNSFNNYTSNDEIKLMLMGISSRLDALETAVSTGNSRIDQLNSHLLGLLSNIPNKDELIHAISGLKRSMKGFTRALLLQLFGCHVLGEVDTTDNL
ncbi:hypothetical protein H0G86_013339 [Trichoderma simmonsii]|uniref:Uncharacterized protein n=1 Tax=Trichoderma simmonsii TaxID=1491479 RepID=A0A8G0PLF9_9HYPO|nr:hypothetical protein H0G86_013339 [Trichoderma simmonsii]